MREKVYVYIVKPGEELWDISHLTSEELISNFSDERITVRLLYDEEVFNDLINNPRMLIVSKRELGRNYDQHFSWNIYESSFYEFDSNVYPYGPYEIMTGMKKPNLDPDARRIPVTPYGLAGEVIFRPARKDIPSHNINNHMTIISYSGNPLDNYTGPVLAWIATPNSTVSCSLDLIDDGDYKAAIRTYTKNSGTRIHYIDLPDLRDIRAIALQTDSPNTVRLVIYHRGGIFDSGVQETSLDILPLYYLKVYSPSPASGTYVRRVAIIGSPQLPFDNEYYPLYLAAGRLPDGSVPKWGTYDPDIFFYVVYPKWVKRIYFESGKVSDIIEFTARNLMDYMKEQFYDYTLIDADRYSKYTLNNAYWRVAGGYLVPKPTPRIIEGYEQMDDIVKIQEMPTLTSKRQFENEFSAESKFPLSLTENSILSLKIYRELNKMTLRLVMEYPDGYIKTSPQITFTSVEKLYDIAHFQIANNFYLLLLLRDNDGLVAKAIKFDLKLLSATIDIAIESVSEFRTFDRVQRYCEPDFEYSQVNERNPVWDVTNYFTLQNGIIIYNEKTYDFYGDRYETCREAVFRFLSFNPTDNTWSEKFINVVQVSNEHQIDFVSGTYIDSESLTYLIDADGFLHKINRRGWDQIDLGEFQSYIQKKPYLLLSYRHFLWIISGKIVIQMERSYLDGEIISKKLWIANSDIKYATIIENETSENSYILLYSNDKLYKANLKTLMDEHEDTLDAHILPAKTYEFQSLENDFYTFLPYPKFIFSAKDMKVWDKTEKLWVIWNKDTLTLTDHYEDIQSPKSVIQKLKDIEDRAKRKLMLFPPSLIVGVPEYPLNTDIYVNDIISMPIEITPSDVIEVNYFARHRISSVWFRYFVLGDLENTFNDESVTIDTDDWYVPELAERLNKFLGTIPGIELLIKGIRTDLRRGVKFHFDGKDWLVEEARYYFAQGTTRVKAKKIQTENSEGEL